MTLKAHFIDFSTFSVNYDRKLLLDHFGLFFCAIDGQDGKDKDGFLSFREFNGELMQV